MGFSLQCIFVNLWMKNDLNIFVFGPFLQRLQSLAAVVRELHQSLYTHDCVLVSWRNLGAKFIVPDWGIKSTMAGIEMPPMVHMLKVHRHEIFLNFFWPKSNPYMPLVNFRKKNRLVSFDFRQNFEVRTFTRWLTIRGTNFFFERYQKFVFFKIFTVFLLDGFLDGFSKFWFFYSRNLHFN